MKDQVAPPYEIPFTDQQLIALGKISVLWGQIDEGLNSILRQVLQLNTAVFEEVLGRAQIHARATALKATLPYFGHAEATEKLELLAEKLLNTIPRRNDAMHGCWGRFPTSPDYNNYKVGTFNHQKPKSRFWMEDVDRLFNDCVIILRLVADVSMMLVESKFEPIEWNGQRQFFAPAPPNGQSDIYFERGEKVVRIEQGAPGWPAR